MGYRILGNTEELLAGYEPRPGLEGPFIFLRGVLYYDPKEGAYYDPRTDMYIPKDEEVK